MPQKLRKTQAVLAGLAGLALCGCGVSQELYDRQTTELDRCKQEETKQKSEVEHARVDIEQLQGVREHAATVEANYFKLKQDLKATANELEELHRARERAEQQSEVYRSLLERLKAGIEAKTLAVEVRKGKMLVKLGEQILFDPGKAELKPDGQAALKQVAAALKEIPDRDFLVAGHTDNVPVKSSPFRSNWDLSTARAVTVVRFLQAEGVNPAHLAAAGYSEFDGVGDNDTPDGRARNRRIEVVVLPKLEELPSVTLPAAPASPAGAPSEAPAPAPSAPAAPSPPAPSPPPR